MNIVILCNPENRRVSLFCEAAKSLGLPSPRIVAYKDILDDIGNISTCLKTESILRIESPGENFDTEKKLIALGAIAHDEGKARRISYADALTLPADYGRIQFYRQWYIGFKSMLQQLDTIVQDCGSRTLNSADAIALMFDKAACQLHLNQNGINVPALLPKVGCYDDLRDRMERRGYKRVFIKPCHASSASGVMGFRIHSNKDSLVTSIQLVHDGGEPKLYNSLKVRAYSDPVDVRTLIDFILNEGAVVEEWIPKASVQGKFFDLRIVVINGAAKFILPRLSAGPITNLHLGNQRGDLEAIRRYLRDDQYNEILCLAEAAVRSVKGAFYAGVDILIPAGFGKPRVLELNAFGDLLPGLTTSEGADTYMETLKELLHAA